MYKIRRENGKEEKMNKCEGKNKKNEMLEKIER